MHKGIVGLVVATVGLATLVLVGCAKSSTAYVDANTNYTAATIETVYDRVDAQKIAQLAKPDVAELRHDALTSLRAQGERASEAADVITSSFSADTRGVPLYVEWATFDSSEALVLVEATGASGGQLTTLRLWVLSPSGEVQLADWRN